MTVNRRFGTVLGWAFLALPVCGAAATLAVVASDDGAVILYPLSKKSG